MRRLLLVASCLLAACTQAPVSQNSSLPQHYDDTSFSIDYPSQWTVEQQKQVITDNYQLPGTAFEVPTDRTKTKLLEAMFHVAFTAACPAVDQSQDVTVGSQTWQHAVWNGVGAGNLYEGETYTMKRTSDCVVVTLYAHSCNLDSADCGPTNPADYDKTALFQTFHDMLGTLTLK